VTHGKSSWPEQIGIAEADRKQTEMPTHPRSHMLTRAFTDRKALALPVRCSPQSSPHQTKAHAARGTGQARGDSVLQAQPRQHSAPLHLTWHLAKAEKIPGRNVVSGTHGRMQRWGTAPQRDTLKCLVTHFPFWNLNREINKVWGPESEPARLRIRGPFIAFLKSV